MLAYALRRLLISIPLLILASILVFYFLRLTTDPAQALRNPRMTAEQVQEVKHAMGLDKSGPEQYTSWLTNFVKGDWGLSFDYQAPVAPIIKARFFNTLKLMGIAVLLSFLLAIAIGVYSAVRPYSKLDYTFTGMSFLGISMPIFWFALLIQLILGFYLQQWLGRDEPLFFTSGMHRPGDPTFHLIDFVRHATLPSLALTIQLVAGWSRYERSSMMEVMNADFMRTARAKGLKSRSVIFKHALRNALIPLVTVIGIDVGALFGGLIVTEVIFSWPGMGSLFTSALAVGDYPIVLPWLMITAGLVILLNLVADLLVGILDPRVRYG